MSASRLQSEETAVLFIKIPCFSDPLLNLLLKQRSPLLFKWRSIIQSLLWTDFICSMQRNGTGGGTLGKELGLGEVMGVEPP